jgi:diaminopimelate epimerase
MNHFPSHRIPLATTPVSVIRRAARHLYQPDNNCIVLNKALEYTGSEREFLAEVLIDLVSQTQLHINKITYLQYQKQNTDIAYEAYCIQGSGAQLWCNSLRDAAALLYKSATTNNSQDISLHINMVKARWIELKYYIDGLMNSS